MAESLRVVLDTNVWISGIFFGRGVPAQLLSGWRDGQFVVLMTSATLEELERILRRKTEQFGASPDLAVGWLNYVIAYATIVDVETSVEGVSRDSKDDIMLEAAVNGTADYLVTGDRDLLVLKNFMGAWVVTPREFLDLLRAGG